MVLPHPQGNPGSQKLGWKVMLTLMITGVVLLSVLWRTTRPTEPEAIFNLNHLPLAFVPNVGQSDPAIKYQVQSGSGSLLFTQDGLTMIGSVTSKTHQSDFSQTGTDGENEGMAFFSYQFLGADPHTGLVAGAPLPGKVNYLFGNDQANWQTDVATYEALTYEQLYPGVTLRYEGTANQLTQTFVIAKGATLEQIRWQYAENITVRVDENTGDLLLTLAVAEGQAPVVLTQPVPTAWQTIEGQKHEVQARYVLNDDNVVSITTDDGLAGGDMVVEMRPETLLLRNPSGDEITVDPDGNMYVASTEIFVHRLPEGSGQSNTRFLGGGNWNIYVSKIAPNGASIIYGTMIGIANGHLNYPRDITVDANGHVYVVGLTNGSDFPVQNPIQTYAGAEDAFLFKLRPNGSGFVYSTFLGGAYDDVAMSVAIDATGHVYLTGATSSPNFPLVNPIQGTNTYSESFVTKVNLAGSALLYSTYLGGNGSDQGMGIAVDQAGTMYITGSTESTNFPLVNPLQTSLHGMSDVYLTRLSADGATMLSSTYLGGADREESVDIAIDTSGNAYLTGITWSNDFPIMNPVQTNYGGGIDVFVTKINGSGTAMVYSTYLGGSSGEFVAGIALDAANQAHVVGETYSSNFPVVNALQPTRSGSRDIIIAKLSSAGTALLYSTYLGGSGWDWGNSVFVDQSGQLYLTGTTTSTNFPLVHPLRPYLGDSYGAVIAKVSPDGSELHYSTYFAPSVTNPTDVTLTGMEGDNSFATPWLWLGMLLILVVGAWVTRPRTRKPRSVE